MLGVLIQMMIDQFTADMGPVRMAVLTGKIPLYCRNGYATTGDQVVTCFVAILAPEVQPPFCNAHVHIVAFVRFGQYRTHVSVFYRITAAATKMTVHATGVPTGSAHISCNINQIQIFYRKPGCRWCLLILSRSVVTDQAIDF